MADIEHVSDTALWVATYRAMESERPDAVFRDPLAAVLTGDRGRAIERKMPYRRVMKWMMVARTSAIDRLLLETIDLGADTVLNLGAGLDTRPYRMTLPPTLRWIEADFPHMIELKSSKLANERPKCRLERVAVDLSDSKARRAFLDRVAAGSKTIVVLTEGVIPYLTPEDVTALANDLRATPQCRFWIQDIYSGRAGQRQPRAWRRRLKAAPFKFTVADYLGFFASLGWVPRKNVTAVEEGQRIGRPFPFVFPWSLIIPLLPVERKKQWLNLWSYALFERR